jgi:hypothetical protein
LLLLAPTLLMRESKTCKPKIVTSSPTDDVQEDPSFLECVRCQFEEFMLKNERRPMPSWIPDSFLPSDSTSTSTLVGGACVLACKIWDGHWDLALLGVGIGGGHTFRKR